MHRSLFFIAVLLYSFHCNAQHWQSLNNGLDYYAVRCLYNDTVDNLLYVSGHFKYAGDSLLVNGIATWNGTKWDSVGSGVSNCTSDCYGIRSIVRYKYDIYVGGYLYEMGNVPVNNVSRWDGTEWENIDGNHVSDCVVVFLYRYNNQLLVGGCFDSIGGIEARQIAVWNDSAWSIMDTTDFDGTAGPFIEYKNELYMGGNFDTPSGLHEIARWNGTSWNPVDNGIYGDSWINCFAIYQDELYVGGNFTKTTGNAGNNIMKWDGANWHDVGGGTWPGQVFDMAVYDDALWVVGQFYKAGGVPAQYIAKWDGTKWCGLGSVFSNVAGQICVYNNELYIGGGFQTIDGDTMNYIAKWIGGDYVDSCSAVGINEVLSEKENIHLYPNPAQTSITINVNKPELQAANTETTYRVIDKLGREVKTGVINSFPYTVPVEDLREGMYIIILQNDRINEKCKFVKLRP